MQPLHFFLLGFALYIAGFVAGYYVRERATARERARADQYRQAAERLISGRGL